MEGTFTTRRCLPIQPIDTSGRVLTLLCVPTDHEAVATRLVQVTPAGTSLAVVVRLDVLAASHRVRVGLVGGSAAIGQDPAPASPDTGLWELHETVACASDQPQLGPRGDEPERWPSGQLPTEHRWQSRNFQARFRSRLTTGDTAIADAVRHIRATQDRPETLVGEFPGHESALTALCLRHGSLNQGTLDQGTATARTPLGWETWHLYPGRDPHVVTTTTTLQITTALRSPEPRDSTARVREDLPR